MESGRVVERNRERNYSAQQAVATDCLCINCCLRTFFGNVTIKETCILGCKGIAVDFWILTGGFLKLRSTLWDM